ncbi:MAG: hypothetical protein MSS47_08110 [Bacteroidales bacterium]|nr:hypothetical protein [Bacteroidales bacterium]
MRLLFPALALTLAFCINIPGNAQRRRIRPVKPTVTVTPEDLMNEYRFDEAITALTKMIDEEKKKKNSTVTLEAQLHQARMGAEMLSGTERITIIDSMVVDADAFLSAYRLSVGCGTLAPLASIAPTLVRNSTQGAMPAFLNDFGDRMVFADTDSAGLTKLYECFTSATGMERPVRLTGMGSDDDDQAYPYLLSDGVTLYFAAQGEESLGGYDIFVTRRMSATGPFVKAENVGMPFNSPANDYMMVIDEQARIGWFVSDRRQPAGKVCIYRFVPNDVRQTLSPDTDSADAIRQQARITSIAACCADATERNEALARLQSIRSSEEGTTTGGRRSGSRPLVLPGDVLCTSPSQLKDGRARAIAERLFAIQTQLAQKSQRLEALREEYSVRQTGMIRNNILNLENEVATLYSEQKSQRAALRQVLEKK